MQDVSIVLVIATLVPPLATAALLATGVWRKMQRSERRVASPASA